MEACFLGTQLKHGGLKASKMVGWQKQSEGDALEGKVTVITIKGSMQNN